MISKDKVKGYAEGVPEVKSMVTVNAVHLIHRSYSWIRLKKAVVWWLKYKEWLLTCCRKRKQLTATPGQSDPRIQQQCSGIKEEMHTFKRTYIQRGLTLEDIDKAELSII